MMLGKRAGFVDEPVPLQVEHWAEDRLGVADQLGPRQEMAAGMGAHMAPAKERPTLVGRQLMMHALYGAVTALVANRLRAGMR